MSLQAFFKKMVISILAESFVKTFKGDYVVFGDLKDTQMVMSQLPK